MHSISTVLFGKSLRLFPTFPYTMFALGILVVVASVCGGPCRAEMLSVDGKIVKYWLLDHKVPFAKFQFNTQGYRNTYTLNCQGQQFLWTQNVHIATGKEANNNASAKWRPLSPNSTIANAVAQAVCPQFFLVSSVTADITSEPVAPRPANQPEPQIEVAKVITHEDIKLEPGPQLADGQKIIPVTPSQLSNWISSLLLALALFIGVGVGWQLNNKMKQFSSAAQFKKNELAEQRVKELQQEIQKLQQQAQQYAFLKAHQYDFHTTKSIGFLYEDFRNRNDSRYSASSSSPIPSDVRLKKNIRQLSNALEKVSLLRGIEFEWREQEFPELNLKELPDIGFIAQEVERVFPKLVYTTRDGYKIVNYANVAPLLIEAIKEQQRTIKNLQERVLQLETNYTSDE